MDALDKLINETLEDEDRDILERIGRDQNYAEQVVDIFRGKSGWMNVMLLFVTIIWFAVAIYAAWKCFAVTDIADVVRWGLLATFFMLSAVIAKIGILPSMQTNRVLRAMKRLEMQVALLTAKR